MKATKHIIWMAVLTLTAATLSACSNKDELTPAPQARTYTLTTTLSPKGGVETRSTMTDNEDGSISAAWEVGDQIWVLYTNIGNAPEETMATVTAVDPSTKAATISLTLTNPKNGGSISFGYPAGFFNDPKDPCTTQTGTLDDINANFAAISGTETMFVFDSEVTLPDVSMMPAMCIWKFSFTDGTDDITSAVTKLVIDIPDPGYHWTYEVTPSSLSNIYVALYGDMVVAQPISITAETGTGVYRKAAASVTLAAGYTYTTTGFALNKAEVGKVFGVDGNIYDDADAATAAGTSAVAMITYVGSDNCESSPYNHGLALALSDANGGSNCAWTTSSGSTVHSQIYSTSSFADESGLQYNDATHDSDTYPAFKYAIANNGTSAPTGCSDWFLASGYQWDQMISAAGDYNVLRDGFSGVGGTDMQGNPYWSSTEHSGYYAWCYYFFSGYGGGKWVSYSKGDGYYVRSALAF